LFKLKKNKIDVENPFEKKKKIDIKDEITYNFFLCGGTNTDIL
jgi:hypothetical protein